MLPLLRRRRHPAFDSPDRRSKIPLALVTPSAEDDATNWFLCAPGIRTGDGGSIPGKILGSDRT